MIKEKVRKRIVSLAFLGIVILTGTSLGYTTSVPTPDDEAVQVSPSEKQLFKNDNGDARQNHTYKFEFLRGNFGLYVPSFQNPSDIDKIMRALVKENGVNMEVVGIT